VILFSAIPQGITIRKYIEPVIKSETIKVTAYCPCEKCCGKWSDGQTANGYWIQPGDRFVAAPKHIPFGTKMIVPGYNDDKPVEVKDRGGSITVDRLDVYFSTHQEALSWGVKYLEIKIK
jgi:3D (Asp-Asp-Asp) domain-containing protein